jgi:hypothetical protein
VVGADGGWAIQKLSTGEDRPETLAAFDNEDPDAIAAPVDVDGVNDVQIECTGSDGGSVRLSLTVNGTQVGSVVDGGESKPVLPPGGAGMAAAGPNRVSAAGLALAFDNFVVEDLSDAAEASG